MLVATGCGDSVPTDGGEAPLPQCVADLDGVISMDELPFAPGVEVRYVRNALDQPVTFDVEGLDDGEGGVLWDFSGGATDIGATLELLDPLDAPHGDLFPDASHAVPLTLEWPDLLGYFRVDESPTEQLVLLGMATGEDASAASRTLVVYDEPLVLYRFPLALGDSWEQTVTYSDAVTAGIPNQGVERYSFEVDRIGSARLEGNVEVDDVLRVRVELAQTLAVAIGEPGFGLHQLLWVRPCFGELARAVSSAPDFEQLDELRRFYP